MRKIYLAILFAFMSVALYAQSEHLKFKGIPIDGPIAQFEKQLLKEGFSINISGEIVGRFAGYDDARVALVDNSEGEVYRVAVVYFLQDWPLLETRYRALKSMLISKYGQPEIQNEEFNSRQQPSSNIDKYLKLLMGECNYVSAYRFDNGDIWTIICTVDGRPCVGLSESLRYR